jgi:two-component sensor histidine kinase
LSIDTVTLTFFLSNSKASFLSSVTSTSSSNSSIKSYHVFLYPLQRSCRGVYWFHHVCPSVYIKSNNSGMAKVKIVKNERDPPLFTGKLLIKFQNILRNTTLDIIRHRVKILFSVISSPITLERQKWKSSRMKGIRLWK